MIYPHEFTNIHEFVQRCALDIAQYGYWFYVTGHIPEGRDPAEVDAKILAKYDIPVSKWVRARRKKKGQANIHYVRHQDFFVMFATKGAHRWFELEEHDDRKRKRDEGRRIHDIRRQPLARGGYSISYKEASQTGRGHIAVRIHPDELRALKAYLLSISPHRSVTNLIWEFKNMPFEPYAGVRQQLWSLLREVNASRKRANFEQVPATALRKKRRVYNLRKGVFREEAA